MVGSIEPTPRQLPSVGLRRSEVTGLELPEIDLENQLLRVMGKGNKECRVPFSTGAPCCSGIGWQSEVRRPVPSFGSNQPVFGCSSSASKMMSGYPCFTPTNFGINRPR